MIVAFCGHGDYMERQEDAKKIYNALKSAASGSDVEFFLGGYGNFDSFAYRCAKRFKADHPTAVLTWVTPYISAKCLENQFDRILFPPLEHCPPKYAISHRNRWMAEHADLIIAYVTHPYGGAYLMYQHAIQHGKQVYNIANI